MILKTSANAARDLWMTPIKFGVMGSKVKITALKSKREASGEGA